MHHDGFVEMEVRIDFYQQMKLDNRYNHIYKGIGIEQKNLKMFYFFNCI